MKFFVVFLFFVMGPVAGAKKFATSYVSFDLLNNWHCFSEGTEWICVNKMKTKSTEATIILTAKQKGPSDTLDQYMKYLKETRKIKTRGGKTGNSRVFHVKKRSIQQHQWVDGFHSASEIPNYYTRYLVTTKGSLAVLVTYSAHKDHYTKYASDFASSINSLRVLKSGFAGSGKAGGHFGSKDAGKYMRGIIDSTGELTGLSDSAGDTGGGLFDGLLQALFQNPILGGGLPLGGGALAYFLFKRRKRRKTPSEEEVFLSTRLPCQTPKTKKAKATPKLSISSLPPAATHHLNPAIFKFFNFPDRQARYF